MQMTPSIPSSTSCILFWKYSGVKVVLNGSRLRQNLPNGVIKVARRAESSWRCTCQKPEFASMFENVWAPPSWAKVWSTDRMGCCSLWTFWFNFVSSTQIQIRPSDFGTTTIPLHHLVRALTLLITLNFPIRSNSLLTFGNNGSAIILGVKIVNGLASSFRQIMHSPVNEPRLPNSWGYFSQTCAARSPTALTLEMSCKAYITGKPSKGCEGAL